MAAAEWRTGNRVVVTKAALFPACFVILTLLQLVPLPGAIADALDPEAATLLREGGGVVAGWRPLTLDPPATREVLLRAVTALLVFLAVQHFAAKKDARLIVRAITGSGVAAVIIGLGHRIFAVPQIYGIFTNTRHVAILTGPFINSNHTAEFLELSTFVAIACARQASSQLARVGWCASAVTCAAGAFATLSRTSVLGLSAGAAVIVIGVVLEHRSIVPDTTRRGIVPGAIGLIALAIVVAAIGMAPLIDRFQSLSFANDTRFRLWRDSLNVLRNHPLGIGRAAFETVYPVYRHVTTSFPIRFSFVENEPLQMLIEFGYLGIAVLAFSAMFPVRDLVKYGRRDRVEFALVAAIAAVSTHSLTDFGLETLGVLLPYVAVLGVIIGRISRARAKTEQLTHNSRSRPSWSRSRALGEAPVAVALMLGLIALSMVATGSTTREFDAELKAAMNPEQVRGLLAEARRAHPLDYYYPLMLSSIDPLASPDGRFSPRLRDLNQSLRLCQNCPEVHLQIARTLWRIGRRSQAIVEWSTAVRGRGSAFEEGLAELAGLGAHPDELGKLAENDPTRLIQVARFLMNRGLFDQATPIIAAAAEAGAPELEVALLQARVALSGVNPPMADENLSRLKQLAPLDPRVVLIDVQNVVRKGGDDAGVKALSLIERALDREPNNLDLQRTRIDIVKTFERWSAAERSILGFKQALQANGRSVVEANLVAARIHMLLGRTRDALAEYRMATIADPESPVVWREFAAGAEAARHYVLAREAYGELMRLAPDPQVKEAVRRLDDLQASDRLGTERPGGVHPEWTPPAR